MEEAMTATATPTRTLGDVYRERLAEKDPGDTLMTALNDVISTMAPYAHETGDLRPSEVEWIDQLHGKAAAAGKEAALTAMVEVYERELPRLAPPDGIFGGGMPEDGMVPPDLYVQGGDFLRDDLTTLGLDR